MAGIGAIKFVEIVLQGNPLFEWERSPKSEVRKSESPEARKKINDNIRSLKFSSLYTDRKVRAKRL
jgi:hypothetical protein